MRPARAQRDADLEPKIHLGISRNTVRRYLKAGGSIPYRKAERPGILNAHKAWLRERFLQHKGNCDVVRKELTKELGMY